MISYIFHLQWRSSISLHEIPTHKLLIFQFFLSSSCSPLCCTVPTWWWRLELEFRHSGIVASSCALFWCCCWLARFPAFIFKRFLLFHREPQRSQESKRNSSIQFPIFNRYEHTTSLLFKLYRMFAPKSAKQQRQRTTNLRSQWRKKEKGTRENWNNRKRLEKFVEIRSTCFFFLSALCSSPYQGDNSTCLWHTTSKCGSHGMSPALQRAAHIFELIENSTTLNKFASIL